MLPKKLSTKLNHRLQENTYRELGTSHKIVDFSSNDYLGFSVSESIFQKTHQYLINNNIIQNGATGSRLLTGNVSLYNDLEGELCDFHNCEAALVFNSGYNANLGLLSSVPQRNDIILYDELCHASIRDGIKLSNAKAFKFRHNDLEHLFEMLNQFRKPSGQHDNDIYVVTESIFSMDGDAPDLEQLITLTQSANIHLILDEAHAIGVIGTHGEGLAQSLNLEQHIFARIITFGKAIGAHGAAILGSKTLKAYLVNFSRPFIYTTALTPHSLASVITSYRHFQLQNKQADSELIQLQKNISFFKSKLKQLNLNNVFVESNSSIQCCIISGNDTVKSISIKLKEQNFNVKPILSPTVPKGKERLRFCIHSYNTEEELAKVLDLLSTFVSKV